MRPFALRARGRRWPTRSRLVGMPARERRTSGAPAQYPGRRHEPARPDEARRDAARRAGRHQRPARASTARIDGGCRRPAARRARADGARRRTTRPCGATIRSSHEALRLAASPQLRNMASLGGNVLQRTRCNYFRDTSWPPATSASPGSGCAAIDGVNRRLAVLGVSEHCIANYPGDFAHRAGRARRRRSSCSGRDGGAHACRSRTCIACPATRPHRRDEPARRAS